MSDIRQFRTILPAGTLPSQRDRIPIGYWLAACLIGAVAATVLADWAAPAVVTNSPVAASKPAAPPVAPKPTNLAQLWDAAAAKMPHPPRANVRPLTPHFYPFGERETPAAPTVTHGFTYCGNGPRINCVVDGDTFWVNGKKVRIADIDTPEIHDPRCAREMQMGQRAKQRLLESLNSGDFNLESSGRDHDRYGRSLRRVTRNGRSLGDAMVGEGLAREWDGRRHPWC